MRRTLAAAAAAVLLGTGAGFAGPASIANADQDYASRNGHCSMGAHYTMTVREREAPDRLATTFSINGANKWDSRAWTIRVYRNGHLLYKWHQHSDENNNEKFAKTFRGDDSDKVTVSVTSSYGEVCKRSIRLDND
ncbi:MAG: hypothetical protein WAL91_01110 [Propionicimonas sp.]